MKKDTKANNSRLSVSRETIRRLADGVLLEAKGGLDKRTVLMSFPTCCKAE